MLRNLENIWSKILVNSEEFAMFAVPNIYNLGMLCLYISKNSQYSGVSLTHNSLRLWVFGDIWRGSASSFVQKIINQIFSCQMPNTTEKFEVKVQSVPTSQTKSQSKLEKEIISIQKKVSKLQEECRHERNESIACCATSISIVQHCSLTSTEVTRLILKTGKGYTVSSWIWIKK